MGCASSRVRFVTAHDALGARTRSIWRTAMANSSDFNGHGLAMRNGHGKPTRLTDRERSALAKGRRPAGVPKAGHGMRFARRLTAAGTDPLSAVVYERRSSTITNPDGSIVFK